MLGFFLVKKAHAYKKKGHFNNKVPSFQPRCYTANSHTPPGLREALTYRFCLMMILVEAEDDEGANVHQVEQEHDSMDSNLPRNVLHNRFLHFPNCDRIQCAPLRNCNTEIRLKTETNHGQKRQGPVGRSEVQENHLHARQKVLDTEPKRTRLAVDRLLLRGVQIKVGHSEEQVHRNGSQRRLIHRPSNPNADET